MGGRRARARSWGRCLTRRGRRQGACCTRVCCDECETTGARVDPMLFLPLPIPLPEDERACAGARADKPTVIRFERG